MYTRENFKSGKAVREAFKAGKRIECYQPGGLFPHQRDGVVSLEGPHYPAPHRWYLQAALKDGVIIAIKK